MSVNGIKLMRAIDCCLNEDCKECPINTGEGNCIRQMLESSKETILKLEEENKVLSRYEGEMYSDFAKFLIDKAENGVINITDLPGYVKEASVRGGG